MVREAVALLPDAIWTCSLSTAVALCVLGAVLWLVGGRVSRSVLALAGVATGTIIGMKLPEWRGWHVEPMALAVGGSILLGAAALLMHRTCIGILLGLAMMLWAALATWICMAPNTTWNWRAANWNGDGVQYLHDLWQTLPPGMSRIFPWACFGGLAAGVSISVFWPKLGKVTAHSLIGVTLMAIMGTVAAATAHPNWLAAAPGTKPGQAIMLIGLVLLGVLIQWQITPGGRARSGSAQGSSARNE